MSEPTRLYRWFDADGRLLYVGISIHPSTRASAHIGGSAWTRLAVRMEIDPVVYDDREAALVAEAAAIAAESPLFNIRRPPVPGHAPQRAPQQPAHLRRSWDIGDEWRAELQAITDEIDSRLGRLAMHPDRKLALQALAELADALRAGAGRAVALKEDHLRGMSEEGLTLAEIAEEFGVSKARVSRMIVDSRRRSA